MTSADTNLRETLREVVGESVPQTPAKTPSEGASGQSGETKAGDTPEFISGVDVSTLPAEERAVARKVLKEKASLLEKGYQKKFQEVADYKKERDELINLGITPQKAREIIKAQVANEQNPTTTTNQKKDAKRTLDSLIENAPYEQKEALNQMRKIILEETDAGDLKKEIADLKKAVSYFQSRDIQAGEVQLNSDLDTLRGKFGKEVIEKYEDSIRAEWRKYPNSKAKDILKYVVPDEEYEQALLAKNTRKQEKVNAVSSQGSGVSSSSESIDVKSTKLKDILRQVIKK